MGIKDLIVTPLYVIFYLSVAIAIRPYVTNSLTRSYFIPALVVRLCGAILLGFLYQFYYSGGDTFNFFEHGSRWIYKALTTEPMIGFKLLLEQGGRQIEETILYSQHIWYYRSPSSYFIVKLTSIFDLLTFHTYSASALFFAVFSFSGLWVLFALLSNQYPHATRYLALGILFFPSVILWGSGILKDTITIGSVAWLIWSLYNLILLKRKTLLSWIVLLAACFLLYRIKIYILLCFVPGILFWLLTSYSSKIGSFKLRILLLPSLALVLAGMGYLFLLGITDESSTWDVSNIATRAAITANDIRFGWGARLGGDGGYYLGELDGTWWSMIKLLPSALIVSLFRPFPWEVGNPLMLLASLESSVTLILTIVVLKKKKLRRLIASDSFLSFCAMFTILFAFPVGVSTSNFGSLMRYKIPMLLVYGIVLAIVLSKKRMNARKELF